MPAKLPPSVKAALFRIRNPRKLKFTCPVCRYRGPFRDISPATGLRIHAKCPKCGSLERHRLQALVLNKILLTRDTRRMRVLHFAPEDFFRHTFERLFGSYETADIAMPGVQHRVDMRALPFESGTYDLVYASHVLEHIQDDDAAIREVRRILTPGGLAILPVPLVSERTIEYPEPNPFESMHVRAPGPDYFDRYRKHFSSVQLFTSEYFTEEYQTYAYEDRTRFPTEEFPNRECIAGERHADVVPICHP